MGMCERNQVREELKARGERMTEFISDVATLSHLLTRGSGNGAAEGAEKGFFSQQGTCTAGYCVKHC